MKSPWWTSLLLLNNHILLPRFLQEAQVTHHRLVLIVVDSCVLEFSLGPLQDLLSLQIDIHDLLVGFSSDLLKFSLVISIDLILHPMDLVVVHVVLDTRSLTLSIWASPVIWLTGVVLDFIPDLGSWGHVLLLVVVVAALSLMLDS